MFESVAQISPSSRILAACTALGPGRVTVRAVHAALAGKGSFRDIAPVVKAWKDEHEVRDVDAEVEAKVAARLSSELANRVAVAEQERREVARRAEREREVFTSEARRWRDEIHAVRKTIEDLDRRFKQSTPPATDPKVVTLTDRGTPPELNTALAGLSARLDQFERDLAERDSKLPAALQDALTALSRNNESTAEKIAQVLTDLPDTLRQAPISHVDKEINARLEATTFELTHRAAELATRPDRTDDLIGALDRLDTSASRRQARQTRKNTVAQNALLAKIDALVSALTARQPRKKKKPKSSSKKPGQRTRSAATVKSRTTRKPTKVVRVIRPPAVKQRPRSASMSATTRKKTGARPGKPISRPQPNKGKSRVRSTRR